MEFVYPLDVKRLLERARARGDAFLRTVGLDRDLRDDLVLSRIATRATAGWFPYDREHRWHGALDLGFADHGNDTLAGLPVRAVAAGTVVYEDGAVDDSRGRCQGRVVIRHEKDGKAFYAQYKHLRAAPGIYEFARVQAGQELGVLGAHDGVPHLELAVASSDRLGGDDLAPEIDYAPVTPLNPPWEALRVRVRRLDPVEWPRRALGFEEGFLYSPIEFIRFCRGEQALPDAGPAPTHDVKLSRVAISFAIAPAPDHRLETPSTFRHPSLRVKVIEELGRDFTPPFSRNDARTEAVKAIQLSLRDGGFPSLPANGKYGPKTEDAVRTFQRDKLKPMLRDGPPGVIPGKKESDVRVDGVVDWLTLVGLDVYAATHAKAPKAKGSGDKAAQEPNRPIAPAHPANTFDATRGPDGLSIHVGVRMIKAMLAWYWNGDWNGSQIVPRDPKKPLGVGYSTCVDAHYGDAQQIEDGAAIIPRQYNPEWPDIGLNEAWKATNSLTVPETGERIYHGWGRVWKATGFSNCCNTLMAALSVALGGTSFGVKGGSEFGEDRGDATSSYDITNREAPKLRREFQGKLHEDRSAMQIFGDLFANVDSARTYKAPDGTRLMDGRYGPHICAISRFGMGEAVMPFTPRKNQEEFKKMHIGDLAASDSHAFVIGDVRYAITVRPPPPPPSEPAVKGKKNPAVVTVEPGPHFILDQSSFISSEVGVLVDLRGKSKTDYGLRQVEGQPVLDRAQCDRLLTADGEAEFMRRVEAFLSKQPGDALGPHVVEKIELVAWRIFSANGRNTCARSLPYRNKDGAFVRMTDAEVQDAPGKDASVRVYVQRMGVNAPWGNNQGEVISLGRFYVPLSRN